MTKVATCLWFDGRAVEAMEFLIDKMDKTKTNEEFLESMNA